MTENFIAAWPGKSARDGTPEHPAPYHMLDVAAVAERLIAMASPPARLRAALVLLICLHDLGKMTPGFRTMLRGGQGSGHRHWEWSEVLLRHHDAVLSDALGGKKRVRFELYSAGAGHHGKPPNLSNGRLAELARALPDDSLSDTGAFLEGVSDLWPDASLDDLTLAEAKHLGWWLAGLTSAADWIGSNAEWFPPCPPGPSLADYLDRARRLAETAVSEAGLDLAAPQDAPLYDFALRPMQTACATARLSDGPTLALIEDETGAGKTEAALMLAQRMLLTGKGSGLFFALPTMATADAMFARACDTVGKLIARPSVTLAHGRSALSDPFRAVQGQSQAEADITCAPWLADGRRKALLAHVGVGTIDQALLGVLPTRFATLRLWALSSKILIVDEVHEIGDPYMSAVLERLLEFHSRQGGSAILLTATLPLGQRQRLLDAFARGRAAELSAVNTAYPALTLAGDAVETWTVAARPSPRGPVTVHRLPDADAALDTVCDAAGRGAACVWVRNAVDDAIAAVEALSARGVAVDLLHARFALADRKAHEAAMLGRFGKDGQGREGRVLVATQVVESSLDLDFDVMVSDLAPMAALIQRAGRLWRHMDRRPAVARPVPAPILHVVSPDPDWVTDGRWLHLVLDKGAWVYSQVECWRTAQVLACAGVIEAPDGLRALIEAVHGDAAEPVPEALDRSEMDDHGECLAKRHRGWENAVDLASGYRLAGGGTDDTRYPTRLGVEQRVLVLARADGARGLRPWAEGHGPEAWMLSEVQASARKLDALDLPDQGAAPIAAIRRDWAKWQQATWKDVNGRDVFARTLCPVAEDGTICAGLRYERGRGLLFAS